MHLISELGRFNLYILDLTRRGNILKSVGVKTASQLTPKAQKLYRIARTLRKTTKRLFVEHADCNERIKQAKKFVASPDYIRLQLNALVFQFISSQIKLQKVSPKLRRFTLDDKLLSLVLMKQSPKGYSFLSKIFALPNRKTLTNLLSRVPIETEIRYAVMKTLQKTVQEMKLLDRHCIIMFDDIALQTSLLYNNKCDVIDGFQDNGRNNRYPLFADKAMVFVARGISKKWKQPLAYYFNQGGMKSEVIATCLKTVIREATSIGLNNVACVCDQANANAKAIRMLYDETNRNFVLKGQENRNFGFVIDDPR
ncbi:Transposase protein [Popillia japonica]|uniref:Transposase protein n=1 Tax=Popillia japonica TaxID=7064 RepID=A0AAW1IAL8_POPJA